MRLFLQEKCLFQALVFTLLFYKQVHYVSGLEPGSRNDAVNTASIAFASPQGDRGGEELQTRNGRIRYSVDSGIWEKGQAAIGMRTWGS